MAGNGTQALPIAECGLRIVRCRVRDRPVASSLCRSMPPSAIRIPQLGFSMSIQAISWSPSGAVRIVDQRALPESLLHRDLETIDDAATAIRTLQVRGAPLIGIAAAMGLVAGLRDVRRGGRDAFLARLRTAAA